MSILRDREIVTSTILFAIIQISYDISEIAPVCSVDISQKIGDALTVATVKFSCRIGSSIVTTTAIITIKSAHGYILWRRREPA